MTEHSLPLQEVIMLIKSGNRAEARTILVAHLKANPDDAGAWWLLARAAPSRNIARQALQEVKRLNPKNARVEQAMAKLGASDASEAPATTLADLLSDASNRLLPDETEPEIQFDEINDIDIWVADEEKRKRENFTESRQQHPPPNDPLVLRYAASFLLVLIGFAFIVGMIQRVALPVAAENRCVTESGSVPSASINHAADSSINVPEDALYQMQLGADITTVVYTNSVTEKHSFRFTGSEDDNISINLWVVDAGINPAIELYSPDGQQIAFCDDFAVDNPGALLYIHLSSSGTYTVVISQTNSTETGRYGVEVEYR